MQTTSHIRYTIIMEQTPNPDNIKFITNQVLLPPGKVLEFDSHIHADVSPLAKAILAFPFVKQILIAENYISITKHSFVSWDDILLELRDYIYDALNNQKMAVLDENLLQQVTDTSHAGQTSSIAIHESIQNVAVQHHLPQNEIEQKIVDILNEYIMPAVSQDGGFITFEKYEDGIVYLKMRGSCNGCPSSMYTLKAGIEALLKKMLPNEVKEVRSENA